MLSVFSLNLQISFIAQLGQSGLRDIYMQVRAIGRGARLDA